MKRLHKFFRSVLWREFSDGTRGATEGPGVPLAAPLLCDSPRSRYTTVPARAEGHVHLVRIRVRIRVRVRVRVRVRG